MMPPPELKARIMAEVEREAALLAQAGEGADRPAAPRPAASAAAGFPAGAWRPSPPRCWWPACSPARRSTATRRAGAGAARTVAVTVDPKRAPDGAPSCG